MKSETERAIIVALISSLLVSSSTLAYLYSPPSVDGVGIVDEGAFSAKISMFLVNYEGEPFEGSVKFSSPRFNETVNTDNGSVTFISNSTSLPTKISVIVLAQGMEERVNLSSFGTCTFVISSISEGHYQSRNLSYVLIKGENVSASILTSHGKEEGIFTVKKSYTYNTNFTYFALPFYSILAETLITGGIVSFFQFVPFPRGQMNLLLRVGKGKKILAERVTYTASLMIFSSATSFLILSDLLGFDPWEITSFIVVSSSFFLAMTGLILLLGRGGIKYSPIVVSYMIAEIIYNHGVEIELLTVLVSALVLALGLWKTMEARSSQRFSFRI